MLAPKSTDIFRALRAHIDVNIHSFRRFNTGLAHYVYEVITDQGPFVVRMANPEHWNGIPGGVYWHPHLRGVGVPVPNLLGHDLAAPFPYMILERLRGTDLGHVYPTLTPAQKHTLAEQIAEIQNYVATLPHAQSYGYLSSYEVPENPHHSWESVIFSGLDAATRLITSAGIFDPAIVDRVRHAAAPYEPYFATIPPAPFLDDTTTKNVLIHEGALSGIVDTDEVCFGDRLNALALTHMALLSIHADLDYIYYWAEAWHLTVEQMQIMHLYTACHCVYFMGELGQKFNKDTPDPIDPEHIAYLHTVLDQLLQNVNPHIHPLG